MNRRPFLSTALATALLAGSAAALADTTDHALEPCLNGEVSATGLFPSQAAEDAHHRASASTNALEPAINGEVSASGLYPTQALEDAARGDS